MGPLSFEQLFQASEAFVESLTQEAMIDPAVGTANGTSAIGSERLGARFRHFRSSRFHAMHQRTALVGRKRCSEANQRMMAKGLSKQRDRRKATAKGILWLAAALLLSC
jgi:hypothetical protein